MQTAIWIICLVATVPALYGLHQLGLHLERRGLIYYWHTKSSGGAAYNPFHEIVQPQIQHVVEVREQRRIASADAGAECGYRSSHGDCRADGPSQAGS